MTAHSFPHALVTEKAVYFDGYELPWYISQDGVSFEPGGHDNFNRLRIEFLVESATFREQSWEDGHLARWMNLRLQIADDYLELMRSFA
ncbi:hypothetical protein KIY81_gp52 [Mycobacterium phage Bugsy]|uniref:Uncharacterized protein n=1 Tax=Mycobacterium phage Bugsy TaxID=2656567 RepID=A0A649VED7_9CAUD|nr:hypothetical protein KIY81_gp52 [Mycobacterium phage Bugsy]AMB18530.1 hypothetical protein NASIATALIE_40 [Mycobacterium phage NaSiaTalie]QGJ90564.1 hypothetical protein SEA_BUGSY_42 [Mycobacterium phage Bugsy]